MHQRIPVITAERPFRRYAPHPDPMLLEDGAFADVQNAVIDQGVPRVREGMAEFEEGWGTEIAGGEFYGGGIFEIAPNVRMAARAIWDGNHIRIERNMYYDGPGWQGWEEATAASGIAGDTRMSRPDLGLVQFQLVPASDRHDAGVLVQTGKDLPRLLTYGLDDYFRVVKPVEPPSGIESHPAVATVSGNVNWASSGTTESDSGGTDPFSVVEFSGAPNYIAHFGPDSSGTIGAGEWGQALCNFADNGNVGLGKQVFLLLASDSATDPYPWLKHKIYLINGNSPTYELLYDPEDNAYGVVQATTGATFQDRDILLAAFNIEGLGLALNQVRGIRFEAVQTEDDAAGFFVFGIMGGGHVNGAASYKVSQYANWLYSESPGVTLRYGAAARVGDYDTIDRLELALGDSSVSTAGAIVLPGVPVSYNNKPLNITLPVEPTMYYKFRVPVLTPTQAQGEIGVDEARIYRRDPGEGQYSLVTAETTVTGPATFDPAFTALFGWNTRIYVDDDTPREDKQFEIPAPSAQNRSVPTGYAMCMGSARLYVGATDVDGEATEAAVYVSELDMPMRFRNVNASGAQTVADRDGFVVGLGEEDAVALRSTATSAVGIEGLYCWTSRGLYRISDLRAERIGAEGISAPDSAAEKNGLVLWLDNKNELQAFAGNTNNLSRARVESVLNDVPAARRKFGVGAVWKDFYYLAYSPSGSDENVSTLAYSLVRGQFEGRHVVAAGMAPMQFQFWDFGGDTRLLYWDATGRLWEWMKPGEADDDGSPITLSMTTKRFRSSPDGRMAFRRTQIVADDGEATWTVSHDVQGPDATVTGQIVMPDIGSSPVQVYDSTPGGSTSPIGGAGYSLQTTLSAALPAGTRLCEWLFEGREVQVAAGSAG